MIDRGRRSVEERNLDASQLSTANVEFIHPKLKENMQDDEDPENPFVWLNSYSRVPVSFNEFFSPLIILIRLIKKKEDLIK